MSTDQSAPKTRISRRKNRTLTSHELIARKNCTVHIVSELTCRWNHLRRRRMLGTASWRVPRRRWSLLHSQHPRFVTSSLLLCYIHRKTNYRATTQLLRVHRSVRFNPSNLRGSRGADSRRGEERPLYAVTRISRFSISIVLVLSARKRFLTAETGRRHARIPREPYENSLRISSGIPSSSRIADG